MKRIAFYGGSFDPIHRGHLKIASELTKSFKLDEFVFVPAFHAPHKSSSKPTSAYHRYTMLALATRNQPKIRVTKMELDAPERPYTIETLTKILEEHPEDKIYFVMGADSWEEITTWKEWEKILTIVNIIVVTRPSYKIGFSHITEEIRQMIVDTRSNTGHIENQKPETKNQIYITDAVQMDISSTDIRGSVHKNKNDWETGVSSEVTKYIKKYYLYS